MPYNGGNEVKMGKAENMDDADVMVTLELEDGVTVDCEILTIFTIDEQDYIALLPTESGEFEEGEVFLYRYREDENGPALDNIESEEEYEAVADAFDEWIDSEEFAELDDEE